MSNRIAIHHQENSSSYNSKNKTQTDYLNGLLKAKLSNWFNALPARPEGTGDIPDGTSGLASYFMKQGKKVNRNNLQELADSAVVIRMIAEVSPLQQWHIQRELRRLIKLTSDRANIEIPYSKMMVYQKNEGSPSHE